MARNGGSVAVATAATAPAPVAAAAPTPSVTKMGGSLRDHVAGIKEQLDSGLSHVPDRYVRPEYERLDESQIAYHLNIPVIDFKDLLGSRRPEIIRHIGQACEEWGFFQVINHGIDVQKILRAVNKFYELPAEQKKTLPSHNADSGVTFTTGFNSAPGAAQDWKDALILRRRPGLCDGFLNAPEIIREDLLEYREGIDKMAEFVYSAVFESLGLKAEEVKASVPGIERLVMAINFYPPCPDPGLVFALSAHSDVSSFTILLPDEVPGLQVRKEDKWVPVVPEPDAFIINIADQIEILTNAKYKSVEHRVIANKGRHRISLAAFYGPTEDSKIAPLPALCTETNPPFFREVIFGEYLRDYYSQNLPLYKTTLNYAGGKYVAPSDAKSSAAAAAAK